MVFGNEDPLLIYVDNLHLANDETREYLRYMIEYGKGFNVKKNEISVIAPFVMVADCSSRNRKEYTARVCRHFAELYLPICEDDIMKNIFSVMLQSAVKRSMVNSEVKQLFEGDL